MEKRTSPEREAFSDEDSDEEDSDYEEIVIPEKTDTKRKRGENEEANSIRIKPNPKLQIRIPKKSVPPAMPNKQVPRKRPLASMEPPRPPFWSTSKAIQTESIEALILLFSRLRHYQKNHEDSRHTPPPKQGFWEGGVKWFRFSSIFVQ